MMEVAAGAAREKDPFVAKFKLDLASGNVRVFAIFIHGPDPVSSNAVNNLYVLCDIQHYSWISHKNHDIRAELLKLHYYPNLSFIKQRRYHENIFQELEVF